MAPKRVSPRGQAAPPVEPNVAPAKITKQPVASQPTAPAPQEVPANANVVYVRNLRGIECRFTLSTGLRVELKPRGQRDDIKTVPADQQWDPIFSSNHGLLFEVIDGTAALAIIKKQAVNASQQPHSLLGMLTNERGENYAQDSFHVDPAFERQGFTVAQLQAGANGRFTEGNVDLVRQATAQPTSHAAGPQTVQVPGSPGHPATHVMQSVPGDISPEEYHEFLLWKRYREALANQPEPEQIRESLNVTMEEPVQVVDDESAE